MPAAGQTSHAIEKALFKIFNNDFAFATLPYQRPYAWTTEQASELPTDLLAFLGNGVTVHGLAGDWSIFRRENLSCEKTSAENMDLSPFSSHRGS